MSLPDMPFQITEKDLYALIGEQATIIRVQEQIIARLREELERAAAANGTPARRTSEAA